MRQMTALPLREFAAAHAGMTRKDFLQRHPYPFLVVEKESGGGTRDFHTVDPDTAENAKRTQPGMPAATEYGEGVVHAVEKSDRNSFANMVTLGRSSNNDIVIEHRSVSKLHILLRPDPDSKGYSATDVGSTNGTMLNGTALAPNRARPLESGNALNVGGAALATYFETNDFFDYLELLRRTGQV